MSEYLIRILKDKIVGELPKEKREIYEHVINMEDEIAEEAATAEEFMVLLKSESAYGRAARYFNMTTADLLKTINQIDREIGSLLEMKLNAVRWKDCTELVRSKLKVDRDQKIFFLSIPK
ncbi:hypothetical protein LF817_00405 [Halobacillus sp. A1]|uniref:hypothetical protein n=1 Tax=Halobacillus sp. A1 TaxID=2880262 RepID=UPI0020A6C8FF|nr:hypothetical protein [Halobacillus sp. A1]MCP3029792.1 hypothetical protein [Halobacillus sp. A1]